MMTLREEEGLVYEIFVDGMQLEHVQSLSFVLDESDTNGAEHYRKVVSK